MRRQNFYLLLVSLFLLLLPISKDSGFRIGIVDYISDISRFTQFLFDPRFATEPIQLKALATLYVFQALGWIAFAVALFMISVLGIVRTTSPMKSAAVLSVIVLIHGVLEVILSVSLASSEVVNAVFTRFGLDFTDFLDDYDALFNSTLVPIGLILWFIVNKRQTPKTFKPETSTISESVTESS